MHKSSFLRMEWFVENYLMKITTKRSHPISVLDVGSCDVNGSYKPLFPKPQFSYVGLDMAAGKNVDIVPRMPYSWTEIRDDSYDVIISGQCFEHVEFPWVLFEEMARILKPNGLLCVITPRHQLRHRYPVDTYRYDSDGMLALAKYANLTPEHVSCNEAPIHAPRDWFSMFGDCMMVARKPKEWPGILDVRSYQYIPWPMNKLAAKFVSEENHPSFIRTIFNLFKRPK
ncbi:MAG: class I SAM-dependent methyltransferase [Desulfovibrio sp.]|nr:class I SAM-dependent methyltransferase [Desulfovibrio sp.]